jgi:aspartyl-tRNA(Asn)/glutamyl-tRNA(Gln) amidotransferase subunit C
MYPVSHVAHLAHLDLAAKDVEKTSAAFAETLAVVDTLQGVDVANVQPTFQVTGLENVWREDNIDEQRMFTQAEATANAHQVMDGFFVVPQVIDAE